MKRELSRVKDDGDGDAMYGVSTHTSYTRDDSCEELRLHSVTLVRLHRVPDESSDPGVTQLFSCISCISWFVTLFPCIPCVPWFFFDE